MSVLYDVGDGLVRHLLYRVGAEHVEQLKASFKNEPLITDEVIFELALLV